MNDHTVLLTGGTSGIGWETARALACSGCALIIAGRSPARVEAACAGLRAESGNPQVSPAVVDLASLGSVRQCAADLLARHSRLHVLINNADTFCLSRQETEGGFERTLGINYLGPFLLTACLNACKLRLPHSNRLGNGFFREGKPSLRPSLTQLPSGSI